MLSTDPRTLLDQVPLAILIFKPGTGRLHYANRQALAAHGVSQQSELEQHLTPMSEARPDVPCEVPWTSRHAHGHDIQWLVKLDTMTLHGLSYVVGYAQDITARLAAERALQAHHDQLEDQLRARTDDAMRQQRRLEGIIDALPVTLNIKDRQGRYQLSNRLFEIASGLRKEELIGCSTEALYPATVANQIRQHEESLFNGASYVRFEQSRPRPGGVNKDLLITKVPLMDENGRPESILTLGVDITDLKTLQRELAAAKTEAERLTRVKSEFLANMSHEIRTPLHGMLGQAQVGALHRAQDPEARRLFDRIIESGRHLLGVINDTLDFSKIDAGKLTLEHAAISPAQIARDALAVLEDRAQAKGLQLSLHEHDLPETVMCDGLRLRQILINLLSNAIKFTQAGSVTLTASAADQALVFEVRDTGIGMNASMLYRIFRPFEQADGSTTRRFGGTGLGLSISRQLAQLMGGDIDVSSTEGQGSTFVLRVPLRAASTPVLATAPSSSASSGQALAGLHILAADDVDINRDILIDLLQAQGATVVCASHGQQAIDLVDNATHPPFDLVLMDVQMPVMDGLDAARRLRQTHPQLPILALTAHAMPEERRRCLDAGMVGHLAKPFETLHMVQAIVDALQGRPSSVACMPMAPAAPPEASNPPSDGMDSPPGVDLQGALRRCGGKPALLHKLLARFVLEQTDFVERCHQLLSADQIDEARRAAHMLRGMSANLGMDQLSAHADALEQTLSQPGLGGVARALHATDVAIHQHMSALRAWLVKVAARSSTETSADRLQ